jgi:hypothetical protein
MGRRGHMHMHPHVQGFGRPDAIVFPQRADGKREQGRLALTGGGRRSPAELRRAVAG